MLRLVTGVNIFSLLQLPRPRVPADRVDLVLGVGPAAADRQDGARSASTSPIVGIVVPTGYSFNLDGTAIYLTMASLFIAEAHGQAAVASASRSRCWSS